MNKQAFFVSGALSSALNRLLPAAAKRSTVAAKALDKLRRIGSASVDVDPVKDLYGSLAGVLTQQVAKADQRLGTPLSKMRLVGKAFTRLKYDKLPDAMRTAGLPADTVLARRVPSLSAGAVNAATLAGSFALYNAMDKPKEPQPTDPYMDDAYYMPAAKRACEILRERLTKHA